MLNKADDVDRFYSLLKELSNGLGGMRILKNCTGKLNWPERGVYFFFEPEEFTKEGTTHRVVRVGTHALKEKANSRLWGRLRTHRGGVDGSGNHRGSIFRLHIGAALIAKSNGAIQMPTWGKGQNAPKEIKIKEKELEREVSKYLGEMSLLWLGIKDEPGPTCDRSYIERNCIGLLSSSENLNSNNWLGKFSPNPVIRASGLWNVDYISRRYCPKFLDVLAKYIDVTLGKCEEPQNSIAPNNWLTEMQGIDLEIPNFKAELTLDSHLRRNDKYNNCYVIINKKGKGTDAGRFS